MTPVPTSATRDPQRDPHALPASRSECPRGRCAHACRLNTATPTNARRPLPVLGTCTLDLVEQRPAGIDVDDIATLLRRSPRSIWRAWRRYSRALEAERRDELGEDPSDLMRRAFARCDALAERVARLRLAIGEGDDFRPRSAAEGPAQ